MKDNKHKTDISVDIEVIGGYNGSIDDLERDFNILIEDMEVANSKINSNINIDELNEISEDVLKAREYLNSFASGERKTVREKAYNQMTNIPLMGDWAKRKIQEVQSQMYEDSSVKEVLEGIFNSFTTKKNRLLELTIMLESMRKNLLFLESSLGDYMIKMDYLINHSEDVGEKMRALEMSNMALSQDKIIKEMIYNNLNIIMELMKGLHNKITKTLPAIKSTLTNSLNIVGAINSIKDTVAMLNTLETLSNEINQKSTANIQELVITTTESLSDGVDIDFYKQSALRNEEFNKTLLEARKKHIRTTIENYGALKQIGIDSNNQIEYRKEQEALILGEKINEMKNEI